MSGYLHWSEMQTLIDETPNADTHRFYLCRPSKEKKDALICSRIEDPSKPMSCPDCKHVTIAKGCPELFTQIVLSKKLNAPVAMGPIH